jgi:mannose-binding lectin 1
MQAATHSINNVYRELVAVEKRLHDRHDEQATKEPPPAFPISQFNLMDERLARIERIVLAIQSDVEGRDYKEHLTSLQQSVREAQTTLLDNLPQSMSQSKC